MANRACQSPFRSGTYEEKYFGCYSSHSAGTENAETYVDDRANVWKSPMFRKWIPLAGFVALIGIGYIVHLFRGGLVDTPKEPAKTAQASTVKPVKVTETLTTSGPGQPEKTVVLTNAEPVKKEPEKAAADRTGDFDIPDLVADLSKDNRIRVAGYIRSANRTKVIIEWRDTANKVVDSLTNSDLESLGWHVLADNEGRIVVLARPGQRLLATAWPIDEPVGKVLTEEKAKIAAVGQRDYPQIETEREKGRGS